MLFEPKKRLADGSTDGLRMVFGNPADGLADGKTYGFRIESEIGPVASIEQEIIKGS